MSDKAGKRKKQASGKSSKKEPIVWPKHASAKEAEDGDHSDPDQFPSASSEVDEPEMSDSSEAEKLDAGESEEIEESDESSEESADSGTDTKMNDTKTKSKSPAQPKAEGAGPSAIPLEDYSDSSEDEKLENTVGDIPMKWYDDYDHIGYNRAGQKIPRRLPKRDQLDDFLFNQDPSKRWTIYDPVEDKEVELTPRDRQLLRNIQLSKFPDPEFDPYEVFGDPGPVMIHPVTNIPEPKSRFVPSRWEIKRINYLASAIKKGWIKLDREPKKKTKQFYMLWDDSVEPKKPVTEQIPAPKLKLPGHAESYNPSPEYIPTEEEVKAWQLLDPEDRPLNFIPKKYDSMRHIPAYPNLLKERFERCLDLYLAPRKIQHRRWVDNPDDLLPKLPHPRELKPFPTVQMLLYRGHTDKVRCISVDPSGQWLVSGSDGIGFYPR